MNILVAEIELAPAESVPDQGFLADTTFFFFFFFFFGDSGGTSAQQLGLSWQPSSSAPNKNKVFLRAQMRALLEIELGSPNDMAEMARKHGRFEQW